MNDRIDKKTQQLIKKAWAGMGSFYKEDEMHWEDNEKEVGFLKDIDALNAFLEPYLLSPSSFVDPPIEIELIIKHLEMIITQLEGVESNKDGGDYRGFTSRPYSYVLIEADFTDSTSSFLILASNVVDFLQKAGKRKEKLSLDLETRLKGVVLKAVDSLLESRVEDQAGVRWRSIKIETDSPELHTNVFFTNYAVLSLYRVINNKIIERWLDERKSEIEKVLEKVPKWVESLYDHNTKRYWADTKQSQVHVATTAYALEINYTLYKYLSDGQISQSRDAMNTLAETIIREPNNLQADIYYTIPLPRTAGIGFYDDRFYVGRLLSLLSLVRKEKEEVFTSVYEAAGETLFGLVQEEWVDESTNMWDDGRPLICFTKDAMLGIGNYSASRPTGIVNLRESELIEAVRNALKSSDDINSIVESILEKSQTQSDKPIR